MPSRRPSNPPAPNGTPAHDARLAAALRANLARRKAQAAARRGTAGAAPPAPTRPDATHDDSKD
jgi:hypothetical protein